MTQTPVSFRTPPMIAFLFIVCCGCTPAERVENIRPNIIIILADDLGYGELGCYGNANIQTPHLDQLAANGLRFTDFHSNGAVCSPTRAALMTGRYQQRSGIEGVVYAFGEKREVGLPIAEETMADLLKEEGYATGLVGKWHLGYRKEFNPVRQGFDEFVGYVSGNVDYHSHYDGVGIYDWYDKEDSLYEEGYTTDLITQHSIAFIQRNKDQPFFLYIAHEAPHYPFQVRSDPAFRVPGGDPSQVGREGDVEQKIMRMTEIMDEGIGAVWQTLKDLDLDQNTLIFFLSDNGGEPRANNSPLRGHKGHLWDGGHRVPAIAHCPGRIASGVTDQTAMSMDLLPTVLAISGAEASGLELDGTDLTPLIFEG
ncbi:MAG: sulfatase-like hydrolase/transferase, partial [Bacteroidota bacterium]